VKDSTLRFSDRAEAYAKSRPGYPEALYDALRGVIGLRPEQAVADIGSGTGILSEIFLRHGHSVFGVEPNAEMRRAAEQNLRQFPAFRSIDGRAEQTNLAAASVDLVTAAQAFHWFDPRLAREEFQRILRTPGWVALIWNDRRTESPFEQAYEQLLRQFGTDYGQVIHRNLDRRGLDQFFSGAASAERNFLNAQRLDLEGLQGRLLSSSYVPAPGQPNHEEMLAALRTIFEAHQVAGRVRLEYETRLYLGQLRPGVR
jgi:SAM-dependent methyltransferase